MCSAFGKKGLATYKREISCNTQFHTRRLLEKECKLRLLLSLSVLASAQKENWERLRYSCGTGTQGKDRCSQPQGHKDEVSEYLSSSQGVPVTLRNPKVNCFKFCCLPGAGKYHPQNRRLLRAYSSAETSSQFLKSNLVNSESIFIENTIHQEYELPKGFQEANKVVCFLQLQPQFVPTEKLIHLLMLWDMKRACSAEGLPWGCAGGDNRAPCYGGSCGARTAVQYLPPQPAHPTAPERRAGLEQWSGWAAAWSSCRPRPGQDCIIVVLSAAGPRLGRGTLSACGRRSQC